MKVNNTLKSADVEGGTGVGMRCLWVPSQGLWMPAGSDAQHAAGQMYRPQPHDDTVAARRISLISQLH